MLRCRSILKGISRIKALPYLCWWRSRLGLCQTEPSRVTNDKYDNGDLDVGVKGELSVTSGVGPASGGKNYEVNVTVMEGVKTESKDVIGIGF